MPWTAPSHAALPHGEPGSEPFRRRSGAPDEPSMVEPRAALSTTPNEATRLDVDTIVDKVQRKLLRRFAAEKERRGGLG